MNIEWVIKKFELLTPDELYAILQLRNEVFVVEQNCVFQDADNKDQFSTHLMGWQDNTLIAYTRLVPPGKAYPEPSIGRVVTAKSVRNKGAGKLLMERSISEIENVWGNVAIKIGAQLYLKKFYSDLGFIQSGDIYLEDGIEHIEMLRAPSIS
ncbi:MAG TPA: GNAT family N-acetyltransferase [Chitinophagaceae bacterium]|nr:GNAT family N-acetyltransferase [Chitinophagaceae bacterium]MCB9056195.1 GNAT family N-acetyltransferase [Chitinophagales bacterium]HPG12173.1 GNAT family N-acetyltransferase [Chitinophagaceae bacterium]